jgi:hypothetical protein
MNLSVDQGQAAAEGSKQVTFYVTCKLQLKTPEREKLVLYGNAALTGPPLEPPDPHAPPPEALLTEQQFEQLVGVDGFRYESLDIRKVIAFVKDLKQACHELLRSWKLAETTNLTGDYPIRLPSRDPDPVTGGFDSF